MKFNFPKKFFIDKNVVKNYLTRLEIIDKKDVRVKSFGAISLLIDIPQSFLIYLRKKDTQIDFLCKKIITKHFRPAITKTCESCQKIFEIKRTDQRFCSLECARKQMGKIITKHKTSTFTSTPKNETREPFCIHYNDCLNQVVFKNGKFNCKGCPDQKINNLSVV